MRTQAVIEDIAKAINVILDQQAEGVIKQPICFIWDSIGSIPSFASVVGVKNNMYDGGYGIDKLTNSENQFDNKDVIAKLTSDMQAFGRAIDLNNDLTAECRSKVKEYMKDIEGMLTQDLERREKYFSGYNDINPNFNTNNNIGFDYGYTNRYRDNMYAPGHKR